MFEYELDLESEFINKYFVKHSHRGTNFHFMKTKAVLTEFLKPKNSNTHKGDFGHIWLLEGHPKYIGASRLAALAALKTGAGLLSILQKRINHHPQDLAEFMKKTAMDLKGQTKLNNILLLGPGLSQEKDHQDWALKIITEHSNKFFAMVLDADGLSLLKSMPHGLKTSPKLVCTPHIKEAALLLKTETNKIIQNPAWAIEQLSLLAQAKNFKITWVLKSSLSLIANDPKDIFVFSGQLPILSTGGSGDVLAGAISGLIPQCSSTIKAALLGLSLQQASGKHFSKTMDRGLLPSELAKSFPSFLKRPE